MKVHNSKMKFCCFIKKFELVIPIIVMIAMIMIATGCGSGSVNTADEITVMPVPSAKLSAVLTSIPEEVPTPIPTEQPTVLPTRVPAVTPTAALTSTFTSIPNDDIAGFCTSPNGKYTAVIKNGIIIEVRNSKGDEVTEYNVEDGSVNSVMSLSWFNNNLLCIFAHVNPSTSYYCIYDVEQKQVLVEKYGGLFVFIVNDNYESLIYTQVPPHFSDEKHIERILDINDEVLYEAPEDMIISGLCPDNETGDLAFTTQNMDPENNHLTVLFKADNRQWSIPLDFSSSIKTFRDGQVSFMNCSYITINADSDSQTHIDKPSGGVYFGKWEQLERLRYVEGSVVSIEENEDGTVILNLKIKVNYHGGADPVDNPDFPYIVGDIQEFILQSRPDIQLTKGEDIVVYQTGVRPLSEALDRFAGAVVMYYKNDGKYYDTSNNAVTMPPEDYPQFEEVFNQSKE